MLINLSNHPSTRWSIEQTKTAQTIYGEILDLPFPSVKPEGDSDYINSLANEYVEKVKNISGWKQSTIHLMGEMTLTFALIRRFQSIGLKCVAATSERIVIEIAPNKKDITFHFVQFREYESII